MAWLRRRKRWRAILLGVVLLAGALVLAFFLTLRLTAPAPLGDAPMPAARGIPSDWVEGTADTSLSGSASSQTAWRSTGTLALTADGRSFGEETYELGVSPDGAVLESAGRFRFKVLVATIDVTFEQRWEGDAALEPTLYTLHMDAPFGQGQEIVGTADGDRFATRRNRVEASVTIVPERTVILGTFSTYAILPLLFDERQQDGVASFDVLLFGGQRGTASPSGDELPTAVMERDGTATARAGGLLVRVERYTIRNRFGDSVLYANGKEFLALAAGTADHPLLVYRSDYFPDGFQLAADST